ncbi:MAG TPA: hypothetical protein VMU28_00570 [Terriglobales bacterium]|nr:hypothetical protein [Terriglobales bacterium]
MDDLAQPPLPEIERYRLVRQQIEHEDNLVSQRLSWLLGSQSFLFTAYAISLNGPAQIRSKDLESHIGLLLLILPLVSIISAFLIWMAVLAGTWTMYQLRRVYEHEFVQFFGRQLPPVQSTGRALLFGHFAPVILPPVFMVVWLLLIVRT